MPGEPPLGHREEDAARAAGEAGPGHLQSVPQQAEDLPPECKSPNDALARDLIINGQFTIYLRTVLR